MLCMKTELPKTKSVSFTFSKPGIEPTWKSPIFILEEPWNDANSYVSTCKGDSGSGSLITNKDTRLQKDYLDYESVTNENYKMILTAIASKTVTKKDKNGVFYRIPCGTNFYDPKYKEYIQSLGVSQNVASPKIYNWIKDRIENM